MTRRATFVELALWVGAVVVVVVSVIWGRNFERRVPAINLGAAPLVGRDPLDGWDWRFGWSLLGAAGDGGLVGPTDPAFKPLNGSPSWRPCPAGVRARRRGARWPVRTAAARFW